MAVKDHHRNRDRRFLYRTLLLLATTTYTRHLPLQEEEKKGSSCPPGWCRPCRCPCWNLNHHNHTFLHTMMQRLTLLRLPKRAAQAAVVVGSPPSHTRRNYAAEAERPFTNGARRNESIGKTQWWRLPWRSRSAVRGGWLRRRTTAYRFIPMKGCILCSHRRWSRTTPFDALRSDNRRRLPPLDALRIQTTPSRRPQRWTAVPFNNNNNNYFSGQRRRSHGPKLPPPRCLVEVASLLEGPRRPQRRRRPA